MKKVTITLLILLFVGLLLRLFVPSLTNAACSGTSFPTSLTNFVLGTCITPEWLNAIETKIGINNSTLQTSLDYKINVKITTSSLSAITPLSYNSNTGVFSLPTSTISQDGFLRAIDWATFNAKITTTSLSVVAPLSYNNITGVFSIPTSTDSVSGFLSAADHTTFSQGAGIITSITAGENINYLDVVRIVPNNKVIHFVKVNSSSTTGLPFGESSYQRLEESFTLDTQTQITGVKMRLRKELSPAGNLVVSIKGPQGGLQGASSTIVSSTVTSAYSDITVNFNVATTVLASVPFRIEINMTTAPSATDYYGIGARDVDTYASGTTAYYDGSWHNLTSGLEMMLLTTSTFITTAYRATASSTYYTADIMGFAAATTTIGNTLDIYTTGLKSGFNDLVQGATYYMSDDWGRIQLEPGTVPYVVGKAITTSSLFIKQ